MPIYEYECTHCGHVFDRLQKIADPDPDKCPECGQVNVRRRVTAPAFRLAGSGWYETDFKKDGDMKRNLAGGDGCAADCTSEGTCGDGVLEGGEEARVGAVAEVAGGEDAGEGALCEDVTSEHAPRVASRLGGPRPRVWEGGPRRFAPRGQRVG